MNREPFHQSFVPEGDGSMDVEIDFLEHDIAVPNLGWQPQVPPTYTYGVGFKTPKPPIYYYSFSQTAKPVVLVDGQVRSGLIMSTRGNSIEEVRASLQMIYQTLIRSLVGLVISMEGTPKVYLRQMKYPLPGTLTARFGGGFYAEASPFVIVASSDPGLWDEPLL